MVLEIRVGKKEEKILDREYDVIVIGGGIAGITAGIYLGRYRLKTLIITKEIGGLLNEISVIDDYPGFKKISGPELAKLLREHVESVGVSILEDDAKRIYKLNKGFSIHTEFNGEFKAKAIIVATGSRRNKLNVPGENLSGVSYCAECDAPLFKDKIVAVVGGGNSAFHDALVLSNVAKKVYIIHRRNEFRADPLYVEEAKKTKNIEFVLNKTVLEIKGTKKVEKIVIKDNSTGEISELEVDGVFVAIGLTPSSEILKDLGVNMTEGGNIIVDECGRTNIEGILAAGDVTQQLCNLRQLVTAAAQGAVAAMSAFKYIKTGKWK